MCFTLFDKKFALSLSYVDKKKYECILRLIMIKVLVLGTLFYTSNSTEYLDIFYFFFGLIDIGIFCIRQKFCNYSELLMSILEIKLITV